MSQAIPATVRNSVWIKYIGSEKETSVYFCCELQPIDRSNYECGHLISRSQGGPSTLDNLRPICDLCNESMETKNMNDFKKSYGLGNADQKDNNSFDLNKMKTELQSLENEIYILEKDIQRFIAEKIELEKKETISKDRLNKLNLNKSKMEFEINQYSLKSRQASTDKVKTALLLRPME